MFSNLFSKKNTTLGIDIGTANIKIAQITHGANPVLDTYGIVNTPNKISEKDNEVSIKRTAEILKSLMKKAGVTTRDCTISFPNSSVFSSVLTLPGMDTKELGEAVEFEAKKYVPLPLTEIDLSWTVISTQKKDDKSIHKVLLTAVPKQITSSYMRMFSLAGLDPQIGEIEALALIRSLIGNAPKNCVIIDIGAKVTGLNIVEQGFLRLTRNLNIGGDTITDKIAQSLNISYFRAEQFKKDFGVSNATFIPDAIKPVLNLIKDEVRQFLNIYQSQNNQVEKMILVGGGANLPGIVNYFEDLNVKVELGDALKTVAFSKSLELVLKRNALSLPVAIGLALRKK